MHLLKSCENQLPQKPTPRSATTQSSSFCNLSTTVNLTNRIPQLDGEYSPLSQQQYQSEHSQSSPHKHIQGVSSIHCDNCDETFNTREELELHTELHPYGCDEDECGFCYTSKYLADLHELEAHPETSYVRDHIPALTKEDFARGKRCA